MPGLCCSVSCVHRQAYSRGRLRSTGIVQGRLCCRLTPPVAHSVHRAQQFLQSAARGCWSSCALVLHAACAWLQPAHPAC